MPLTKFSLPVLHRATLKNFSLFSEQREVVLEVGDGVSCLVGANGIGKSTFIAAINFGLCGRIPEPDETFHSSGEYFQNVRAFTSSYFDGRISELDRKQAEIDIEFSVAADRYHIRRSPFHPDELLSATVNGDPLSNDRELGMSALNELYKSSVAHSVGVPSFEHFVFLQFFVFTFDERRHLTFWETEVQRQMLLLAFGEDAADAQLAENLRRRMERLESNARNANYQATETRKRLENTQRLVGGLEPDALDLLGEHEKLDQVLEDLFHRESSELAELADSELRAADLHARSLVVREQIDETFGRRVSGTHDLSTRPIITDSVSTETCQLCGATGSAVVAALVERTSAPDCPLCGTTIPTDTDAQSVMQQLADLDTELAGLAHDLQDENTRQHRLRQQLHTLRASITEQQARIAQFERDNRNLPMVDSSRTSDIRESIRASERMIRELNEVKRLAREERDEAAHQLREIQDRVAQHYRDSEAEFLEIFKTLAEAFLGLDIDVRFDARRTDISLVLEIDGHSRREHHQLSESQRFFVDIALRMAVASFVAADDTGTLLIDTPEGSLDIAYESRAGEMFAQFVDRGYHMIMTANINTSQLLRSLAGRCGSGKMSIVRMTEWTKLSEVQSSAQKLFEGAYEAIEAELQSGPAG